MRRRSNKQRSYQMVVFGFFVVLILVVFLRGFVEKVLHVAQRPFVIAGTWIYQKTYFLESANVNQEALKKAQEQLQQLAFDRVRLEELEKENIELKQALDFIERNKIRAVSASIVSRSHLEEKIVFTIDQGSDAGISVGDPVMVQDGILVGKVAHVSSASATIQTLAHPDVATAVSVLGQTQTIGVTEGISGNLLRLKFIPQDTQIKINDLVVSSGLESRVPSGLFIGLVNDVRPESNAPFLEAIIEPLADTRLLNHVHVLIQEPL